MGQWFGVHGRDCANALKKQNFKFAVNGGVPYPMKITTGEETLKGTIQIFKIYPMLILSITICKILFYCFGVCFSKPCLGFLLLLCVCLWVGLLGGCLFWVFFVVF